MLETTKAIVDVAERFTKFWRPYPSAYNAFYLENFLHSLVAWMTTILSVYKYITISFNAVQIYKISDWIQMVNYYMSISKTTQLYSKFQMMAIGLILFEMTKNTIPIAVPVNSFCVPRISLLVCCV